MEILCEGKDWVKSCMTQNMENVIMCLDLSPNVHRFLKNNFTRVIKQTNSNLLYGLYPHCKLLSTQDFLPPVQRVSAQAVKASWMAAVNTFPP